MEIPQEIRRVLQQLDDLERQRRKPLFTERKIGKSVSVNSHLGFPLKVLEELSEKEEHGSPQKTKKTHFFENTYEQLRQQKYNRYEATSSGEDSTSPIRQIKPKNWQEQQRPNRLYDENKFPNMHDMKTRLDELKLPEHVDRFMANIKSPLEVDSGVGTPLSPPSTSSNSSQSSSLSSGSLFSRIGYKNTPAVFTSPLANRQTFTTAPTIIPSPDLDAEEAPAAMHPLSMVGEVNVKFNGTTQLKSIRPSHYLKSLSTPSTTILSQTLAETDTELEPEIAERNKAKAAAAKATANELAPTAAGGNS